MSEAGTQQALWLQDNKSAHIYLFLSFIGFAACCRWPLFSFLSSNRHRHRHLTPKASAQVTHAFATQIHALISLVLALRSLLTSILGTTGPNNCDPKENPLELCYDQVLARSLDFHAGFLVFEIMFYINAAEVGYYSRFPMLLLHHTIGLLCYLGVRIFPMALTAKIVPLYELLGIAQYVQANLEVVIAEMRALHVRLNALRLLGLASLLRAVGAIGIAAFSYFWLSGHGAMTPKASLLYVGGGVGLAYIYIKWFGVAHKLVKGTQAAVAEQRRQGSKLKKESASGARGPAGRGSSKKKHKR